MKETIRIDYGKYAHPLELIECSNKFLQEKYNCNFIIYDYAAVFVVEKFDSLEKAQSFMLDYYVDYLDEGIRYEFNDLTYNQLLKDLKDKELICSCNFETNNCHSTFLKFLTN